MRRKISGLLLLLVKHELSIEIRCVIRCESRGLSDIELNNCSLELVARILHLLRDLDFLTNSFREFHNLPDHSIPEMPSYEES
jgi:hypothetical protein